MRQKKKGKIGLHVCTLSIILKQTHRACKFLPFYAKQKIVLSRSLRDPHAVNILSRTV